MLAELQSLQRGFLQGLDASEMGKLGVPGDYILLRSERHRGRNFEVPLHMIDRVAHKHFVIGSKTKWCETCFFKLTIITVISATVHRDSLLKETLSSCCIPGIIGRKQAHGHHPREFFDSYFSVSGSATPIVVVTAFATRSVDHFLQFPLCHVVFSEFRGDPF
mmetsp:Transcript_68290/g.138856  ORF Transcript_68290/g.138856 Transcript_68290/m.138856 type:complete len:163 (+) Transcript_68290:602-1090(+)